MKFSVLTIHPKMLRAFCSEGLLAKARQKKLIAVRNVDIRRFAAPPHFHVDAKPYGGGAGMLLSLEPIVKALRSEELRYPKLKRRVILFSAKGKPYRQRTAERFSKYEHLVFICGRYEGVDERIAKHYADEEIRIGDYVLMGGELAAGVVMESVARLLPDVLGNRVSLADESFSQKRKREYPQYTRPRDFEGHQVPEVLFSGNHRKISEWREGSAK